MIDKKNHHLPPWAWSRSPSLQTFCAPDWARWRSRRTLSPEIKQSHIWIQCKTHRIRPRNKAPALYAMDQTASEDNWWDKNESELPTPKPLRYRRDVCHIRHISRSFPEFLSRFIVLRECVGADKEHARTHHPHVPYYITTLLYKPLCAVTSQICPKFIMCTGTFLLPQWVTCVVVLHAESVCGIVKDKYEIRYNNALKPT